MKLTSPRFPSSVTVAPAFLLVALLGLRFQVSAQVIMDGTLGRPLALSGPAFLVTPDLGRQVGGNLFHSFSKLTLVAGESATFSGPANVQNVLARVTGGASSIDGTLRSTIAGANLYLLNPRGVMFGQNARVDVSGSFVVSTAAYLKLTDGGRFDARMPANSVLKDTAVEKFGFLSMAPAKITVDGSQLVVPNGQTLTLVGGDLELKNGALVNAPHGTVNLTSVGAVATEISAAPALTDLPTGGTITLNTRASVDVSGEGGGLAVIRSRDLTVDNASVRANTTGNMDGQGIDVQLGGAGVIQNAGLISAQTSGSGKAGDVIVRVAGLLQVLNDGSISSDTFGAGKGGKVDVTASALTVAGGTSPDFTFISSDSNPGATGPAGDVKVTVTRLLQLCNNGSITSDTSGSGSAGKVAITAGALTIDGGTRPDFTGISSETLLKPTGRAGDVNVQVTGLLRVLNGGRISSTTSGSGPAGTVEIKADALTIDGGTRDLTGIASNSKAGATGNGGDLTITVDGLLQVLNGGRIDSDTSGRGDKAGQVRIKAGALTIDGGTSSFDTFISSDSNPGATGPAGDVKVTVTGLLQLCNNGSITSDTSGSGSAGKVEITAGALTIDGGTRTDFTGISSETLLQPPGRAGDVKVVVTGLLQVLNGGKISSNTSGSGNAGTVDITAGALTIDGGTRDLTHPEFTGISSDSKAGATGKAGDLNVQVGGLLQMFNGGKISSTTSGSGNAGRVAVKAGTMTLLGSDDVRLTGVFSDSDEQAKGDAGQVAVTVSGRLLLQNGGRIATSTAGAGDAGEVTVTAGTLTLNGEGLNSNDALTGIASNGALGKGGNVAVTVANLLQILNGAEISADATGAGKAGKVGVTAGALIVDGGTSPNFTGISSETAEEATGNSGEVNVLVTGLLQILNGGQISTDTKGSGDAGKLTVRAGALRIAGDSSGFFTGISSASNKKATGNAGNVNVQATGAILLRDNSSISSKSALSSAGDVVVQAGTRLDLYHSAITTEASQGNGGELRLTATERIHLDHSQIFSKAGGSGGNIFLDPVTVSLNQSTISANAVTGNGGNITINTGYLLRSQDSQITASSQFGLNGQISVLGPSVDLSGSLVTLPGGLLAADSRLPERCAVRLPGNLSSFISVGRGGLPLEPQDYQPMFLLLDERSEKLSK